MRPLYRSTALDAEITYFSVEFIPKFVYFGRCQTGRVNIGIQTLNVLYQRSSIIMVF